VSEAKKASIFGHLHDQPLE